MSDMNSSRSDAPGRHYITNCVQCGRIIDKREADEGGDGFGAELSVGSWVCSSECWDAAVGESARLTRPEGQVSPPLMSAIKTLLWHIYLGKSDGGLSWVKSSYMPPDETNIMSAVRHLREMYFVHLNEKEVPDHAALISGVKEAIPMLLNFSLMLHGPFGAKESREAKALAKRLRQVLDGPQPTEDA